MVAAIKQHGAASCSSALVSLGDNPFTLGRRDVLYLQYGNKRQAHRGEIVLLRP